MHSQSIRIRTGDPELMRQINRAVILDLLRNNGKLSRAQIARKLKLSKATVSRVVNELIKDLIIEETGEGDAGEAGGRRPIMVDINSCNKFVMGIDLGTTNTVIAIANLKGEIINKIRVPTNRNHSIDTIIAQVTDLVEDILKQSNIKKNMVVGLGIAVAGVVEKDSGVIEFSPNFNWENINIVRLLEEKTGIRTLADNCTRTMTMGETWYGNGKAAENLFYINLGYGIGSAMVIDGKIYNNHSEFGHIMISSEKIRCSCGKYGCLETVASGNAIERKANQQLSNRSNGWITAKDLAEWAKQGDLIAKKIFEETSYYLGKGIAMIANVFNPDKIIIGGGVSGAGHLLLEHIQDSFNKYTMKIIKSRTKIELSSLGMDAGVYGAISMILNKNVFYTSLLNN